MKTARLPFPNPNREFPIPIYGGQVYVYLTDRRFLAACAHLDPATPRSRLPAWGRFKSFINPKGEVLYLLGWYDADWTVLVHEVTHLALDVFDTVGIDPRDSNGEALAYLVQALLIILAPDSTLVPSHPSPASHRSHRSPSKE